MNILKNSYFMLLQTYLKPQWLRVLLLALLLLGGIGLEVISPQILRQFIDSASVNGPRQFLLYLAGIYVVVAIISQIVEVVRAYVAEGVGLTATNGIRADLTLHCLQLDPAFHHSQTPGELIQRVDNDAANLNELFSDFVIQLLGNLLLLICILILSFLVDWRVGLLLTGFAIIAVVILYHLRAVGVSAEVDVQQSDAEVYGFIEERLSGKEDICSSGANAYTLRQFHHRVFTLLRKGRYSGLLVGSSFGLINILLSTGIALALTLGVYLFRRDIITLGTIYLIFAYTELLRRPLESIRHQISNLQEATASLYRIGELFNQQPAIRDGSGVTLSSGSPTISFASVSFSYQPDKPVLQDISFDLPEGTTLGLLGRTGSGKTTLTRLLFRLYDPLSGSIQLNGHDLKTFQLHSLRQHIGLVPQEVQLFKATVRENLTLFDTTISDQRIEQVLQELGLGTWYDRLPNGLETELTSDRAGLSAGEAQLLAFGRVFLRDPEIVILDEASSRLDIATERLIDNAIKRLLKGRTAIIIAHRLTTIQRVDSIMILDNGQIREYGSRQQLAMNPQTHFAYLLKQGLEEVLS